jgi:hypothetical protein
MVFLRYFAVFLRCADRMRKLPAMRDLETIDSELRLLAAVRRSIRKHGGEPSSRHAAGRMQELTGS